MQQSHDTRGHRNGVFLFCLLNQLVSCYEPKDSLTVGSSDEVTQALLLVSASVSFPCTNIKK